MQLSNHASRRRPLTALYLHAPMNASSCEYALMPMGVPAMMNGLRSRGWRVTGINWAMERSMNPAYDLPAALAARPAADLVLIDLHWYMNTSGALTAAEHARAAYPEACICVGGLTASSFAADVLRLCPAVDVVVVGDGDPAVADLADQLAAGARHPDGVTNGVDRTHPEPPRRELTTAADFDALDFVTIDWLDHWPEYYRTDLRGWSADNVRRYWLEVGRGCMYACGMCGGGARAHRTLSLLPRAHYRSAPTILDDLRRLKALAVDQVALSHDIFGLRHPVLPVLDLDAVAELELGVLHEFWNLPDADVLRDLLRAFDPVVSEFAISPESGDETVRRRNFPNKNFSNDMLLDRGPILRETGVEIELFFAANLPFESTVTWKSTLDLLPAIVESYGRSGLRLYSGYLTLDPASPMWQNPAAYDITPTFSGLDDYFHMTRTGDRHTGYRSDHLTNDELMINLEAFSAVCGQLASG